MNEMTSRERILRTYRHEETDRMPMVDSAWAGTIRRWQKEGLPEGADWAHERGMVTELHSCGYIDALVPDLVDIGVDMLNPLEIKAGMDPFRLKKLYGDKLTFHGGINAQLRDKPEEVEAEMRRIIPVMREGGGYVFASDHSIPNSVSFESMTRIVSLAREPGRG